MKFPQPKSWLYVWHVCILTVACFGLAFILIWVAGQAQDLSDRMQGESDQGSREQSGEVDYIKPEEVTALTSQSVYGQRSEKLNLDPSLVWKITATGDIIPARGVDYQVRRHGAYYPFEGQGIAGLLSKSDLTIANLEAPLIANCPVHNEGFTFCGQAAFAKSLAKAGVSMVSLENNHIGNFGQAGIEETRQLLEAEGIDWADSSTVAVVELAGMKVGHVAFNGIAVRSLVDQDIVEAVRQAKADVDFLIVSVHWGKEYELVPMSDPGVAPDDPLVLGPQLVEAGADLILGNHAHWVQGVEMYKDRLIGYGLGNFIFDQSWSLDTSQGVVAEYTYYGHTLLSAEFHPVQIMNQAQPVLLEGVARDRVIGRMKDSTAGIMARR